MTSNVELTPLEHVEGLLVLLGVVTLEIGAKEGRKHGKRGVPYEGVHDVEQEHGTSMGSQSRHGLILAGPGRAIL